MKKPSPLGQVARLMFELGTLRKVVRAHRQTLLTDDLSDNIASHSFRVAWLGYFLATKEKADTGKVMLMCLLHDLPEARAGDQNWIHKRYIKVFEDEIRADQFAKVPGSRQLKAVAAEYDERITVESKLAKDADMLDQILLLKEHAWGGNQEAAAWLKEFHHRNLLTSATAKKLAREIYQSNPSDWWQDIWTNQRR